MVATSIWSGESTGPHGYTSFAVARGIAGIFAGIPQILTGGMISSMFFLHERGKAFAIYSTIYVVATIAGPTFSGFIVQHTHWSVTQWWCVGSNALSAILIFLFVEETGYNRDPRAIHQFPRKKQSWIGNRIATFFPGTQVVPVVQASKIVSSDVLAELSCPLLTQSSAAQIFYRSICHRTQSHHNLCWPLYLGELQLVCDNQHRAAHSVAGTFRAEERRVWIWILASAECCLYVSYSFAQTAVHPPTDMLAGTFALWFGGILAVLYGVVFNDRIPLMLARRRGGWHPELRLHTSWFPGLIVAPIGLGVLAAGLHHHWHYMVLAVASFLVTFGAVASVPVSLNYVIESFKSYPQEVGACLNVYRITLSLTIPFYYETWEEAVGIQWVYGIMAFLSLGVFALVILLMFKGKSLRRFNLLRDSEVEE